MFVYPEDFALTFHGFVIVVHGHRLGRIYSKLKSYICIYECMFFTSHEVCPELFGSSVANFHPF